MKRTLVLAFFALTTIVAFAQQDQKAKSILDEVTETTKSNFPIQASFEYVLENKAEDIYEVNEGTIIIDSEKYQLKLPTLGVEMFCDGSTVWSYMVDAMEVSISSIEENSGEMTDLSGLFTIYENGFDNQFVEETTVDGTVVYVIDLIPTTAEIEYSKIRILIDKSTMLIKKAEMISDSGSNYLFNITELKTNIEADDSIFAFDEAANPDVYVIDMR